MTDCGTHLFLSAKPQIIWRGIPLTWGQRNEQNTSHSERVSILERYLLDIVPPYTLSFSIKYPNGGSTNLVITLVDTGSPVRINYCPFCVE